MKLKMKMKMKRQRFCLITAIMIVAVMLAGCADSRSNAPQPGTSTGTAKQEVTISIFGPATGLSFPDGLQNDLVAEQLFKDTGVRFEMDAHPDDAKLMAILASGDLPDIINIFDTASDKAPAILRRMISSGHVVPIDGLLESHGKDILANAKNMVDFCRDVYGVDGKLYNLQGFMEPPPPPNKGSDSGIGPVIRIDYWAELGYPEIKDADSWLNAVKQMLEKHPTTDTGEKRYGFSPFFEWGWISGICPWGEILSSWKGEGIASNRGGYLGYDIATRKNKDIIANKDSTLWRGMDFLYTANKMGLVDPDVFINTWDSVVAKTSADRVLSSNWTWAYGDINAKLAPEAKGYALVPVGKYMVEGTASPLGCSYRLYTITSKSAHPEAAMTFINYLYSYQGARTFYSGIRGEHYIEKDGRLVVPEAMDIAKKAAGDANWAIDTGVGKYGNYAGLGPGNIDPKYGQKVSLSDPSDHEKVQALNPFQQMYCDHFKISRPEDIYQYLELCIFDGTIASLMAIAPDDIREIDSDISNYLGVELPNLLNAASDAEYETGKDRIIAECIKKGLDRSSEFWSGAWKDALAIVYK